MLVSSFVEILLCLQCILVTSEISIRNQVPYVQLTSEAAVSGAVKFSRNGRPFSAFLGIPFGTVPERFAEPELITKPSWTGVREFVEPGPMCPQMSFDPTSKLNDNEYECLNLQVYSPMNVSNVDANGWPVLLWIHGGGFYFLGGAGFLPDFFMENENVVVVTFNYRLGVFGFLSTGDEVVPGNNGLKDMRLALEWIQLHIAKFGGNPGKVTIFGQSAGSAAVNYLMLSPTTKGLFHRAISQSGSAFVHGSYQINPKENAIALATHLNCSDVMSSKAILSCLRSVPKDQLILAQLTYDSVWPLGAPPLMFLPTCEPEVSSTSNHKPFLTRHPFSSKEEYVFPAVDVPWVVGVTEDEAAGMASSMILTDNKLIQEVDSQWSDRALELIVAAKYFPDKDERTQIAKKLKQFYFGENPFSLETADSFVNFNSDGLALQGVYKAVKEAASSGRSKGSIYLYQYAYHGPVSIGKLFYPLRNEEAQKSGHGDDLQHQFQLDNSVMPGYKSAIQEGSEDEEFSRNFVRLWISFATHGEPKHSWGSLASEQWKPVTKSGANFTDFSWYRIDSNPKPLDHDPYKKRMEFWDGLWQDHFSKRNNDDDSNKNTKTEL